MSVIPSEFELLSDFTKPRQAGNLESMPNLGNILRDNLFACQCESECSARDLTAHWVLSDLFATFQNKNIIFNYQLINFYI